MIPTRWPSVPLRRLGAIVGGGTPGPDEQFWGGDVPFITPPDLRPVHGGVVVSSERTLTRQGAVAGSAIVPKGSVILSIRAPIGYVAISGMDAAFNQGCRALVPGPRVVARFLAYALMASGPALVAAGRGTTFMELSGAQMAGFEVPAPPVPEQWAIADLLDREAAQIDTLVVKQERLIAVLRERRAAVVDSELRAPVGAGERLRWVVRERDERAGSSADLLPLLSVSISWGVRRRAETGASESRADDFSNYKVVAPGDIVVNRMRAFQGALGVASEAGKVSPDYTVLIPEDAVASSWLAMVMTSSRFVAEMASRIRGIGSTDLGAARTPRINVADLLAIRVDVPPLSRQEAEVDVVGEQAAQIDALIARAEQFIGISKERRLALITAAVTGQIGLISGRAA